MTLIQGETGEWEVVIGLEVHAQIVSNAKLFSGFGTVDAILTPTAPSAAFPLGEKMDDPIAMYLNDVFTVPANMAGLPGLSVPAGLSAEGLPLGLQLLGRAFDEAILFRVGEVLERAAGFDALPTFVALQEC